MENHECLGGVAYVQTKCKHHNKLLNEKITFNLEIFYNNFQQEGKRVNLN